MDIFEYENASSKPGTRTVYGPVSVALIFVIFVFWLFVGGMLTKAGIRQLPKVQFFNTIFAVKQAGLEYTGPHQNVLIGSSRVHRQFSPAILESACGETYYNLGIGGADSANIKFLLDWLLVQDTDVERIWIEPIGADSFDRTGTDRNIFYSPFWPAGLLRDRVYDNGIAQGNSPTHVISGVYLNSLTSYFSVGALRGLDKVDLTVQDIPYQFGLIAENNGYTPLEQFLSPRDQRLADYQAILARNPNFVTQRFSAFTTQANNLSAEDQREFIHARARGMLSDVSRADLERVGLVFPPPDPRSQFSVDSIVFKDVTIPVVTFPTAENEYLLDAGNWMDSGHLKGASAVSLSEYFAAVTCGR